MSLAVVSAESAARKVRLAEAAPGAAPHAGEGARRNAARESTAALLARVRERLRRLSRAGAGGGDGFSVLCLGVDQLDVVDAGLGPPWSEALLAAVGNRLSLALGAEDAVSPLGGGRFAVLLSDAAEAGEAMHAAEGLQEALAGPYPLAGHDVFTTISAGIAVADAGYPRPENLLRDAHAALAQAVARGRGVCRVFEASMHQRAVELLRLEAELRRGVEHGELALYYQPIVCLQSGRISGFEALLRWRNPVRGLLAPSAFLAMAEASGQIVPIGRWALREACAQLRRWRDRHPGAAGLTVNVNLSTRQFLHPHLVADVEDALAAAGLPGSALRLELTENALMESGEVAVETFCRLKAQGVQLCIDDFGVGYSSLAYLHRFPVDVLKIDRSFVSRLGADGESGGIVQAIVSMAHGLGAHVVPEGVETADQLQRVRALQCGYAQGYFFAAPLAAADAEALLATGRRW